MWKSGHYAKDCYKKQADIISGKLQHGNYASSSHDDRLEKLFAMQYKMHSTTMQDDVWYVDSGASNHMTNNGNWFKELDAMRTPSYVEIGDDRVHPIEHIGRVPLVMQDGKFKHLEDVLHVPMITKNLESVGQMVDQGLQVRFNSHGDLKIVGQLMAVTWRKKKM